MENKTILLISPQPWSQMYVSKHHYAIELAKRNNQIFFLNPVRDNRNPSISILPHEEIAGLHLVTFSCLIPYWFKFHFRWIFDLFIHTQVRRLLKKMNQTIDIVWDFDANNSYRDLKIFKAKLKIFHPVDQSLEKLPAKKKPDVIFSVSHQILSNYIDSSAPKHFINHGVGGAFLDLARSEVQTNNVFKHNSPRKVAYIGNLMIPVINHYPILYVIENHPQVSFHFWGPYDSEVNDKTSTGHFIKTLQSFPNAILHGKHSQKRIVDEIKEVDLFIFNYKSSANYNCDNSHKVLEYLSTGKVVLGSLLKVYEKEEIIEQFDNDEDWIEAFDLIIKNTEDYNQEELQLKRKFYAINNSYFEQIERINKTIIAL